MATARTASRLAPDGVADRILTVSGLTADHSGSAALVDVDFSVAPGQSVGDPRALRRRQDDALPRASRRARDLQRAQRRPAPAGTGRALVQREVAVLRIAAHALPPARARTHPARNTSSLRRGLRISACAVQASVAPPRQRTAMVATALVGERPISEVCAGDTVATGAWGCEGLSDPENPTEAPARPAASRTAAPLFRQRGGTRSSARCAPLAAVMASRAQVAHIRTA